MWFLVCGLTDLGFEDFQWFGRIWFSQSSVFNAFGFILNELGFKESGFKEFTISNETVGFFSCLGCK